MSVRLKVALQRLRFPLLETCIFLSTQYYHGLPWYYHMRSARYFRTQRGSNFLLPPGERYYYYRVVLPPWRCYRDDVRYYRAAEGAWGLRAGRGSSNSPTPIQLFFPMMSLSLSPAQERRRRPSPDLRLRPLSSHSVRWDRSPPLPLAMEQGFSANPSLFGSFFHF